MAVFVRSFTGITGPGNIPIAGTKSGDIVLHVFTTSGPGAYEDLIGNFTPFVTTAGFIGQNSADFSGQTFSIMFERKSVF